MKNYERVRMYTQEIILPCELKDIDYQVDPYVGCEHHCHYCYALAAAETDWSKEIQTHKHIVRQPIEEMDTLPPQTIYMGYHTDPYQPFEAEYRQTRKALELFLKKGFSASIPTKSDLVFRDLDILKAMKNATVSVLVVFKDNSTRRLFEAATMDTANRVEAGRCEDRRPGLPGDSLYYRCDGVGRSAGIAYRRN